MMTAIAVFLLLWGLGAVAVMITGTPKVPDRMRLALRCAGTLAILAVIRAIVPWQGWLGWGWVIAVAGYGAALGLAARQWPRLPAYAEGFGSWRRAWAGAGLLARLAVVVVVVGTFV